jgi:hypothetical protein
MRAKRTFVISLALVFLLLPVAEREASGQPPDFTVSGTSVTLRWTAPGDDWNIGRAWQYDLRFSTERVSSADTLAWWNSTKTVVCSDLPRPGIPGTTDSFSVGGLVADRTYYFVLRTSDEVPNWSFFSNIAVVTTGDLPDTTLPGDDTPPAPVAGLTVTAVAEGLFLTWSPAPDPDVVGYLIYRGYSGGDLSQFTQQSAGVTSYLDTQLVPGVTYFYAVTAVDDAGNESAIAQSASATAPSIAPQMTQLLAPFPAPCLKEVILRYDVAEQATSYSLSVFDATGRLVRTLRSGSATQGQYSVVWDLKGQHGEPVAAGVYFSVLVTENSTSSKKLLVLK